MSPTPVNARLCHVTGTQWGVKYCMHMKSPELMDLQKHVVEDVYWRR